MHSPYSRLEPGSSAGTINSSECTKSSRELLPQGARDPILTNNFELLPALLKRGVESVDVEYAYILDREGICLAHTDPSRVGTRFF